MKITAKTLTEPLFEIMYRMSGAPKVPTGEDENVLFHNDVINTLRAKIGPKADMLGVNTQGQDRFRIAVSNAFGNLRNDGRGESRGKGKWALSKKGLQIAKDSFGEFNPPTMEKVPTHPDEPIITTSNSEVSLDILQMMVDQTPCFAFYTARSRTCASCEIRAQCNKATSIAMQKFAREIEAEEDQEARRKKEANERALSYLMEEERDIEDILNDSQNQESQTMKQVTTPFSCCCARCFIAIPANTPAFSTKNDSGLICQACANN